MAPPQPSTRLSLQNLLRHPETTLTLAPAYTLDPLQSPIASPSSAAGVARQSSPVYAVPGAGPSRSRSVAGYTNGQAGSAAHSHSHIGLIKDRNTIDQGEIAPIPTSSRPQRKSKTPSGANMQNPNMQNLIGSRDNFKNDWGFPPSDPRGGHGESSASGAGGRRNTGSPGSMSIYSQTTQAGSAKRRKRQSEVEIGSEEPEGEDDGRGGVRPLAITCAPCRMRKIKCDSKKPACANCSKNPGECYYPAKLKPGLRPGTGTDMVKRLENLEERVQSYEIRLADQEARLTNVQFATNTAGRSYTNQTQTSDNQDPLTSLYSGQSSSNHNMFDLSSTSAPVPNPALDFPSFGPSASPSGLSSHSFRDPQILPPDEIVRDLIGLFFTFIHPWAPVISPILPSFSAPWSIVVHAIVVVTLRYSNDPRLPPEAKAAYRQAAKQHVLAHAIESTSISSVQALALLALDLIGSEQGPSSWGILALLTRSAVHLGLAKEDDSAGMGGSGLGGRAPAPSLSRTSIIPPPADWCEDETRRRLFWLIFCLDRYACVSTGWDFAIPDSEVKRRLPCSDDNWARNEWFFTPLFRPVPLGPSSGSSSPLSPLAHLVEALDMLGRAHSLQAEVIEPGDNRAVQMRREMTVTLTEAVRGWFDSVRNSVCGVRQNGLTLMIQAVHYATLLKLNAYYAYPALSTGEPVEPHTSICLTAAQSVVDLIHTARSIGWMTASTPFFVWGCWVAARVLFVHAFLAHHTGPDESFDAIVECLREQAGYWGLANQYVKLLERAKRKWLASMPSASEPPNPSLPDAIHVLLDLRRTAYSAVTTNTQETPHVSPPDVHLSHLPAWAVQPLLGDLHGWFDLPAGLFQGEL